MHINLFEISRVSALIDEETIIIITIEDERTGLQRLLACGNWYNDDVLDHIHKEIIDMRIVPTDNKIFVELSPYAHVQNDDPKAYKDLTDTELLYVNNEIDYWDMDLCEEICKRADMSEEWKNADDENFNNVIEKAIEILEGA